MQFKIATDATFNVPLACIDIRNNLIGSTKDIPSICKKGKRFCPLNVQFLSNVLVIESTACGCYCISEASKDSLYPDRISHRFQKGCALNEYFHEWSSQHFN